MTQKEYITQETATLFSRHGLKSVRMDDIATQLGISKRTIYELFKDRESLIIACLVHYFAEQDAKDRAIASQADSMIEAFILLIEAWEENYAHHIQMMEDLRRFHPKVFEKFMTQRHEQMIEKLMLEMKKGVAEGIFIPEVNLNFAVAVFTNSIYTLFAQPTRYISSSISVTEAFKYITIYFFRGIATKKGIALIDQIIARHQPKETN